MLHYLRTQSDGSIESEFCIERCRSNLGNATDSTSDTIPARVSTNATEAASLCLFSSSGSESWDSRSPSITSSCSNSSVTSDSAEPIPTMPTMHASDASYDSLCSEPQAPPRPATDKGRSWHFQRPVQASRADAVEAMPPSSSASSHTAAPAPKAIDVRRSRSMPSGIAAPSSKDQVCRDALAVYLKEMTLSHVRYEPTEEQKNDPAFAYLLAPLVVTGEPASSSSSSSAASKKLLNKRGSFSEASQGSLSVKAAFKRVWGACKARMGRSEAEVVSISSTSLNCKSLQSSRARGLKRTQAKAAAAADSETIYIIKHRSCPASKCPFGLETIIEVPTQEVEYRRSYCT